MRDLIQALDRHALQELARTAEFAATELVDGEVADENPSRSEGDCYEKIVGCSAEESEVWRCKKCGEDAFSAHECYATPEHRDTVPPCHCVEPRHLRRVSLMDGASFAKSVIFEGMRLLSLHENLSWVRTHHKEAARAILGEEHLRVKCVMRGDNWQTVEK